MLKSRLDHSKADLLGQLTAKEREVLDLVAARHSSKEIARQLGLSLNGVEWRLSKAREKLHARDRNDLVRTYLALLGDCDRTPVDPIPVSEGPSPTLAPPRSHQVAGSLFRMRRASRCPRRGKWPPLRCSRRYWTGVSAGCGVSSPFRSERWCLHSWPWR